MLNLQAITDVSVQKTPWALNHGCPPKRSTGVIIAILAALLACPDLSLGQGHSTRGRAMPDDQEDGVAQAAKKVQGIANIILNDHVITLTPLQPTDIQQINEALDQTNRYHGRFTYNDRAYLNLVQAYLAHYSGDGEKAIKEAQKAVKADPE